MIPAMQTPPPPAVLARLPKRIRDLTAEHVATNDRASKAHNLDHDLRVRAHEDDHNAARADATAAAESARSGKPAGGTPNRDALVTKRTEAAQNAAALDDAAALIEQDWYTAASAYQDSGSPTKAVIHTGADVARAAEALSAALTAHAEALAIDRWLAGGPYAPSTRVDIETLDPSLSTAIGPSLSYIPPIDLTTTVAAIAKFGANS